MSLGCGIICPSRWTFCFQFCRIYDECVSFVLEMEFSRQTSIHRTRQRRYVYHDAELNTIRHDIPEDLILLKDIYRTTFGNLRRAIIVVQESERIADINAQRYVQLATVQAAGRLLSGTSR